MSNPKICFDRILPGDQSITQSTGAAVLKSKRWENGTTLSVNFLEGSAGQQAQVKQYAIGWSNYANLTFDFVGSDDADIRIAFDPSLGAWSYLGKDCLSIPSHEPTMNLGWVDQGVILHEFGHAIGLIHEHQNPTGGITWNRQAVIDALSGPPNFWDLDRIESNMFNRYSESLINGTTMDIHSIMMYAFPNDWTVGDLETFENDQLSALDKEFIASEGGYPAI